MKTYLIKIFFCVLAMLPCLAFIDTGNKDVKLTISSTSIKANSVSMLVDFGKQLKKKEMDGLKIVVAQKNPNIKQPCIYNLTPKYEANNSKASISFSLCKPIENKSEQIASMQTYIFEVSISQRNIDPQPQGSSKVVDMKKAFPELFVKSQMEENKVDEKNKTAKAADASSKTTRISIPVVNETDNKKSDLRIQDVEERECHYLKLIIPSGSELEKTDVTVLQQHKDGRSPYSISPNAKEVYKENKDSNALYFIPNTSTDYILKFTIKVNDEEYSAVEKQINIKNFEKSKDCFEQVKEGLRAKYQQAPTSTPELGFDFKSLVIPVLILLLIGAAFYTIMQYRQRNKAVSKPSHKETVATVSQETNSEDEIKFFEPGALASSSVGQIESSKYTKLTDLENYYSDTTVANVFIEKGTAKEIFDFVWQSVQTKPAPEVGGFLMGKIQPNPQRPGLYDVYINAFLKDIAPDFQNNVNISFSDAIASDELDYIDAHQGEEKVGWLHTHPGHGVFLSPTDIGSHFRAFPRATQMAIVIESYDNFKTGVFSYKKGAKDLNNISDKSTIEYKSWKEFI